MNESKGVKKFKTGQLADIDSKQVEILASKFWNNTEIASFIGCSTKTLTNRFTNFLTKGRDIGKGRLRDWQLKSAQGGNVTMLIWLGKQYLNQSDKQELIEKDDNTKPSEVKVIIINSKEELESIEKAREELKSDTIKKNLPLLPEEL